MGETNAHALRVACPRQLACRALSFIIVRKSSLCPFLDLEVNFSYALLLELDSMSLHALLLELDSMSLHVLLLGLDSRSASRAV